MTEQLIEAVAKTLFELHPVARGAKAWDEQREGSVYRRAFRSDALEVLNVIAQHNQTSSEPATDQP